MNQSLDRRFYKATKIEAGKEIQKLLQRNFYRTCDILVLFRRKNY